MVAIHGNKCLLPFPCQLTKYVSKPGDPINHIERLFFVYRQQAAAAASLGLFISALSISIYVEQAGETRDIDPIAFLAGKETVRGRKEGGEKDKEERSQFRSTLV